MKKILGTVLVVLLILVVLGLVGLQVFLTKGLTSTLNKGVFPAVKTMYGLDMSIENASVNILKGTADLQGFSARNLKGYQQPALLRFDECRMDVDIMSLLKRDPIIINEAKAIGAVLIIERNKEKKINVQELADALKPVESAEPESTQPTAEAPAHPQPAKQKEPIPIHIRRIVANVQVLYTDSGRNRNYPLNLDLTARDLFTVPETGQPSSLITLRGSIADDQNSFATDLNAIVEPLIDPAHASFTLSGSILNIDSQLLVDLLEKNDIKSSAFSLGPSIRSTQGQFKDSSINLTVKDLEAYGGSFKEAKLKLPVTGTLTRPWIDLPGALKSFLSDHALDIGKSFGLNKLKEELGKETGVELGDSPQETLVNALTNSVEEISENDALRDLVEQVSGAKTNTNKPIKEAVGDALIDQLEDSVKELEDNEEVKDLLRGLFK